MKQKLAVARAMLPRPELVFLDEPTAGLDPVAAAGLREELASIVRREGVTVFLTTHNLSEAEKLCSNVAVILNGRLLAQGSPDELRARRSGHHTEVVGDGFNRAIVDMLRAKSQVRSVSLEAGRLLLDVEHGIEMSQVISMLLSAGVNIQEIRKATASLEDVFMTLVKDGCA